MENLTCLSSTESAATCLQVGTAAGVDVIQEQMVSLEGAIAAAAGAGHPVKEARRLRHALQGILAEARRAGGQGELLLHLVLLSELGMRALLASAAQVLLISCAFRAHQSKLSQDSSHRMSLARPGASSIFLPPCADSRDSWQRPGGKVAKQGSPSRSSTDSTSIAAAGAGPSTAPAPNTPRPARQQLASVYQLRMQGAQPPAAPSSPDPPASRSRQGDRAGHLPTCASPPGPARWPQPRARSRRPGPRVGALRRPARPGAGRITQATASSRCRRRLMAGERGWACRRVTARPLHPRPGSSTCRAACTEAPAAAPGRLAPLRGLCLSRLACCRACCPLCPAGLQASRPPPSTSTTLGRIQVLSWILWAQGCCRLGSRRRPCQLAWQRWSSTSSQLHCCRHLAGIHGLLLACGCRPRPCRGRRSSQEPGRSTLSSFHTLLTGRSAVFRLVHMCADWQATQSNRCHCLEGCGEGAKLPACLSEDPHPTMWHSGLYRLGPCTE